MWIPALLCIVVGLIVAVFDEKLFMSPLEWFVLAIAFAVTSPSWPAFATKRNSS